MMNFNPWSLVFIESSIVSEEKVVAPLENNIFYLSLPAF